MPGAHDKAVGDTPTAYFYPRGSDACSESCAGMHRLVDGKDELVKEHGGSTSNTAVNAHLGHAVHLLSSDVFT